MNEKTPLNAGQGHDDRADEEAQSVPMKVLATDRGGQPRSVEYAGRVWEWARDQDEARDGLKAYRARKRLEELAGPDHREEARRLLEVLDAGYNDAACREGKELMEEIGLFLVGYGQPRLWHDLFLHLLAKSLVFLDRDSYSPGHEMRYLWGDNWRRSLDGALPEGVTYEP